uniref:Uncharacterized protein n=1 Tax=viral metagenome TaxID=1070528 RepID=A0A6C0J593_9ZZZZ
MVITKHTLLYSKKNKLKLLTFLNKFFIKFIK